MMWKVKDEMNFLAVYENYPSLWSMKVKDYVATKSAFTNFTETLTAEGLLGDVTNRLKQNYSVWKNCCDSLQATELTTDTASTLASEWRVKLKRLQHYSLGFSRKRVYSLLLSDRASYKAASEVAGE